ncbi:class I SAM-dependent methyltransferase [Nonomuraea antri]|uniref:class I SAM-dependent methyltransferase n=1 Tax=Nonomuraea antri TaxID=2730852 RepID=UPI002E2D7750|nr:class I SAM-dependent methyltransferase [Nonomuraea antri]
MSTAKASKRRPLFSRVYPLLARAMDDAGLAERRQALLAGLSGRVVEVGAGNGATFAHYPPSVEHVLAVEPQPRLRAMAAGAAAGAPVPIEVRAGTAEQLPLAGGAVDAVVFAMVLCSVPDPAAALAEAVRVLKPGGQIRFLEHVRADTPGLARVQDLLDATIWPHLVGGCHLGRDTVAAIQRAGLTVENLQRFLLPAVRTPSSFHVLGTARLPALRGGAG